MNLNTFICCHPYEQVDITKPCRWLMNRPHRKVRLGVDQVDITKPCRWLMNPIDALVNGEVAQCRHYEAVSMADEPGRRTNALPGRESSTLQSRVDG